MTVRKALIWGICPQNPTWDFLILFRVSLVLMRMAKGSRSKWDGHSHLLSGNSVGAASRKYKWAMSCPVTSIEENSEHTQACWRAWYSMDTDQAGLVWVWLSVSRSTMWEHVRRQRLQASTNLAPDIIGQKMKRNESELNLHTSSIVCLSIEEVHNSQTEKEGRKGLPRHPKPDRGS